MGLPMLSKYPQCMLPTSRGLVPHITKDYVDTLPINYVDLGMNSVFESDLFLNHQKTAKEILRFTNHQNIVSFSAAQSPGLMQGKDSISFHTYSGVKKIPMNRICASLQWMSVDGVLAPFSLPNNESGNKGNFKTSKSQKDNQKECEKEQVMDQQIDCIKSNVLTAGSCDLQLNQEKSVECNKDNPRKKQKSIQRAISFLDQMIEHKLPIYAPVCYEEFSNDTLDFSNNNFSKDSLLKYLNDHNSDFSGYWISPSALSAFGSKLPSFIKDKLLFVIGCKDICEILTSIKYGGMIFDSEYPSLLTEEGFAFVGSFNDPQSQSSLKINLRDPVYLTDTTPLLAGCECFSCLNHSKCYIHHLLLVNEMLGSTLLAYHNLFHFSLFFSQVRKAQSELSFDARCEQFLDF